MPDLAQAGIGPAREAEVTPSRIEDSTSAPGRRERNKLQKRARIVAAARELFRRQGFADTTTQQIADAADIGTGTLFLYARSKEDLLVMVFSDEMLDTARRIFADPPDHASLAARLMAVFNRMADYHADDPDLARLLLKELVVPRSEARRSDVDELMDAIYDGLTDMIGTDPRIRNPALVARSAFALYYFALLSWLGAGQDRGWCMRLLRDQLSHLINGDSADD
jgi:AcrR family transcriptional regulator